MGILFRTWAKFRKLLQNIENDGQVLEIIQNLGKVSKTIAKY